ncbi:MAG: T9SS type A sorting domain-containing protein [Bernardetiaceae bacterium]|nr:T9SS type A sorting domain-containing protein [Bernardetiaceae bacterium]
MDKNFVDNAYYRLRQVDADYQFELSRVVFLAKEGGNLAGFRLDPNPVDDQQALRLQSSAPPPGEVRVQLFNSVGQLLGEARGSLPQLNEWLNARKTGLATGAYFLRVGTGTAAQILPWVKQ